jgi:hypothetical protein
MDKLNPITATPLPRRLARRPRDHRGFAIPFFVAWLGTNGELGDEPAGVPDFRVIDSRRMVECANNRRCWLCGDKLGVHLAFVLGPMCTINRLISEPPSHYECALYAVKVCPFLTRPRMRRNAKDLPEQSTPPAGLYTDRNPGLSARWVTRTYRTIRPHAGQPGVLFRVGPAESVSWWKEGRPATRPEVLEALADGYRLLGVEAEKEGRDAMRELSSMVREAERSAPFA